MQSTQTKKTLSYIYKICVDHDDQDDQGDQGDVHKFDSLGSDTEQIGKILNTLKYNLNQDKISLPMVTKVKQHSFITLLNHKRKKNSHVNMNTIVSDGYKVYNQYIGNQNNMTKLHNFRHNFAFNNYKTSIPSEKYIKTKQGNEYNVDDLVLLMLSNYEYDPNDHYNSKYLFDNEGEENIIIAHPGLSQELRTQYMIMQKHKDDNRQALCSFITANPDILDAIGEFGMLFINFALTDESFKLFIYYLINKIGDSEDSPLLQFELFNSTTFKSILISAANEKPSPEEFGYYLILLYFTIYDICTKKSLEIIDLPLLPYFKNLTSQCSSTAMIGPVINNAIQLEITGTEHLSMSSLKKLGSYSAFMYAPDIFPNQLVLTTYKISNDLKEVFHDVEHDAEHDTEHDAEHDGTGSSQSNLCGGTSCSPATDGFDLNEYCSGFEKLIDDIDFNNIKISDSLVKLYYLIQSNLNQ